MEFLDHFDRKPSFLSEEFGLIRPDLQLSVAGVLPELINQLSVDFSVSDKQNYAFHDIFKSKLQSAFPDGYDNIIVLICDAVGVEQLARIGGPLWDNITTKGTIADSSFPTMTATVMTTISYGTHPSHHGMVGYCTYNENLNSIYNGLNLLSLAEKEEYMVLDRVNVSDLVNGTPIIELINQNMSTEMSLFAPVELVSPGLDDLILPNLQRTSYKNPEEAIHMVMEQLSQPIDQQIITFYLPYTDHFAHYYGPESEHYTKALRGVEQVIGALMQHPKVSGGRTAIALTSDHGQSQIDHDISRWMDRQRWAHHQANGVTLSTSGRVIHAYCEPTAMDTGRELLEKLADGRGLVIDQQEAIKLAGGNNTDQIRKRMGDYLMIMEDGYLMDVPEFVQYGENVRLHGQHGSLTAKELYVPIGLFGGI